MGIDVDGIRFLCLAKKLGVDFSSTLTLGRQSLFAPLTTIEATHRSFGLPLDSVVAQAGMPFADGVFIGLGAATVESIDKSDFEGGSIEHDLNLPVPEHLRDRFSVVVDGGTSEHVFNFPTALENSMRLVAPGGHLIVIVPANQFLGHGFYQISPELYFRTFAPANGFLLRLLLLKESGLRERWLQPVDPKKLRRRTEMTTIGPANLFVLARRIGVPTLVAHPQQSDYEDAWAESRAPMVASASAAAKRRGAIARRMSPRMVRTLSALRSMQHAWTGNNMKRVDPINLAKSITPD